MAAQYASGGKVESFDRTVLAEGLKGVLRAGGCESAAGLLKGGYADLIESDKEYERGNEDFPDNLLNLFQCLTHLSSVCFPD